jgi:DNA-binding response OmpR family regulator
VSADQGDLRPRALLVEDQSAPLLLYRRALLRAGFAVVNVSHAEPPCEESIRHLQPHVIVADLRTVSDAGLAEIVALRSLFDDAALLVLTESGDVEARVRAYEIAVDDCIAHPLSPEEFVPRVLALIRRRGRYREVLPGPDGVVLDVRGHCAVVGDHRVTLTPSEYRILRLLLAHRGEVLSRETLIQALWGTPDAVTTSSVSGHISHLRQKLGSGVVRTVARVGYVAD